MRYPPRCALLLHALSYRYRFVLSVVILLFVFSSPSLGNRCETPGGGVTHTVEVDTAGNYSPQTLEIHDCDTVVWKFPDRKRTIIPLQGGGVLTGPRGNVTLIPPFECDAYKPFDPNDPNDFTGPMPKAPSGIFSLGPDGEGWQAITAVPGTSSPPCDPADGKQHPNGTDWLCKSGVRFASMPQTWADPSITGVFIRLRWNEVHTGPGTFHFDDSLEREITAAVDNGKLYSLAFKAGRKGTPDWIFDPGIAGADVVMPIKFQDAGSHATDCGSIMTLGSPAEDDYRKHYFDLLRAVAAHLREKNAWYRALAYIKISGANLFTAENRLPKRCPCEIVEVRFTITEQSLTDLQSAGVLEDVLRDLRPIINQDFIGEDSFTDALLKAIGQPRLSDSLQLQIVAHAAVERQMAPSCPICNSEEWARRGGYTPEELYEFYDEQMAVLSEEFPGKSMNYMLIQAGFPKVTSATVYEACPRLVDANHVELPLIGGTDQTQEILRRGETNHGLAFVVQHAGLGPSGTHSWVTDASARGQVTGFQTNNPTKVSDLLTLNDTFRNAIDHSEAIFIEIYEQFVWEAAVSGGALGPSGNDMAAWAEKFHERRRTLWPPRVIQLPIPSTSPPVELRYELPDPFPLEYRFRFTRTAAGSEPQTFYYVDPPVCKATAPGRLGLGTHGIIKILP